MSNITSSSALWYATRATGIVGLVLLTMTLVLGITSAGRFRTRNWPAFANADLHRRVSVTALVFLGLHVLTSVIDTYVHIGWVSIVVPFTSSYHGFWLGLGSVAVDLLLAVAISSALRQRIPARLWRGVHWLAYGSWPTGMAHALGMGTDAGQLWLDALAGLCTAAVFGAVWWRIADWRQAKARFEESATGGPASTRHAQPAGSQA
jgi:methionine sulfoxide reductase heme-binding subunit